MYDGRWLKLRPDIVVLTERCEGGLPDLQPDISVRQLNQKHVIAISCNCFSKPMFSSSLIMAGRRHVGAAGRLIIRRPGAGKQFGAPLQPMLLKFFRRSTGLANI